MKWFIYYEVICVFFENTKSIIKVRLEFFRKQNAWNLSPLILISLTRLFVISPVLDIYIMVTNWLWFIAFTSCSFRLNPPILTLYRIYVLFKGIMNVEYQILLLNYVKFHMVIRLIQMKILAPSPLRIIGPG